SHPYLFRLSPASIAEELRRAQETIRVRTGAMPRWFRAPYGVRWFGLRRAQTELGLTGLMWTAIGYDWKLRADQVVARMPVKNGSLLCLPNRRELCPNADRGGTVHTVCLH